MLPGQHFPITAIPRTFVNMADVWTCCQCNSDNLIANAPEVCPICSHVRRSCCKTGRPTFSPSSSTPPYYANTYPNTPSNGYRNSKPTYQSSRYHHTQHNAASTIACTPRYIASTYSPSSTSSYNPSNSSSSATSVYHTNPYPGNYTYARPDMRGWWVCCDCKQANNPALAPEMCPADGHKKCGSCRVL